MLLSCSFLFFVLIVGGITSSIPFLLKIVVFSFFKMEVYTLFLLSGYYIINIMPNFDGYFSECKSLFDFKEFSKIIDCCDNLLYNGFDDELILNYKASDFMYLREYKNAIGCYDILNVNMDIGFIV